jgi:pSer/pThr/pTyr-binding forkhead associated (FHA) protein
LEKRFFLKFDTLPGSPKHALTRPLIIGSEVGDIILKGDSKISPRHCVISLDNDVASILDFGSEAGTFVNGQELTPGKVFLLNEKDQIIVGDVPVRIVSELYEEPSKEEMIANANPNAGKNLQGVSAAQAAQQYIEQLKKDQEALEKQEQVFSQGRDEEEMQRKGGVWATFRLMAVLIDFIYAVILHTLLNPYVAYKDFNTGITEAIEKALAPLMDKHDVIADVMDIILPNLKYLMLYMVVRLLTSLIFAVSIGEFLMGMRSYLPFVKGRLVSIPRNIIGFVLWPFLIFDIACLFHRRTLKEWITGSVIEVQNKALVSLGIIAFFPLSLLLMFASPLFQGFESRSMVKVKDVSLSAEKMPLPQAYESKYLRYKLKTTDDLYYYPQYELVQIKKKRRITPYLKLYDVKDNSEATFSLFKKFSFRKMLLLAGEMDPLFKVHYPVIRKFSHDISSISKNFENKRWGKATMDRLHLEIKRLIAQAFILNPNNIGSYMKKRGPFIKGTVEFRDAFYYMLETKKIDKIEFLKLGTQEFVRFVVDNKRQRLTHFLIPLYAKEGIVYKIDFESRNFVKSFYQKFLLNTKWDFGIDPLAGKNLNKTDKSKMDIMKSLDIIMRNKLNEANFHTVAQFIFRDYFDRASMAFNKEAQKELDIIKNSLRSQIQVLSVLKRQVSKEAQFGKKAIANLEDMLEALENKNKLFFNTGV